MRLEKVGKIELTYTDIDVEFPFKEGGQVYGTLTGSLEVGDLRGELNATDLARQRPDDQFTPALRGILKTPGGSTSTSPWMGSRSSTRGRSRPGGS